MRAARAGEGDRMEEDRENQEEREGKRGKERLWAGPRAW